ncbi:MAG: GNAT family N-acetyltransferase [Provencibacterium sp.]|jgi:ribosomal protein S18 acetylase RimI-like enzyme|nr:GNAT family N-acetyltransferase [Provencibacterium sp.]
MTAPFTLRDAAAEDYPGIRRLFEQLHRQHVENRPDIYQDADPLPEEEYKQLLQDERSVLLAAFTRKQAVGLCQLTLRPPSKSPLVRPQRAAFIEALVVAEEYRRQGLGSRLFEQARERARTLGARRLTLNVWCFNEEAAAFYLRMGMQKQRIQMEGTL